MALPSHRGPLSEVRDVRLFMSRVMLNLLTPVPFAPPSATNSTIVRCQSLRPVAIPHHRSGKDHSSMTQRAGCEQGDAVASCPRQPAPFDTAKAALPWGRETRFLSTMPTQSQMHPSRGHSPPSNRRSFSLVPRCQLLSTSRAGQVPCPYILTMFSTLSPDRCRTTPP